MFTFILIHECHHNSTVTTAWHFDILMTNGSDRPLTSDIVDNADKEFLFSSGLEDCRRSNISCASLACKITRTT